MSPQKRRAIIYWTNSREFQDTPHPPAHLLEGLPDGGEVAAAPQGDPWNEMLNELKPIIARILEEEKSDGPVVRPPFARPLKGGD